MVPGKLVVACMVLACGTTAWADITVISGSSGATASGTSGRRGSSTGPLSDFPTAMTGTQGTLHQQAAILGGPVAPQVPFDIFPGTTCQVEAAASSSVTFRGGGRHLEIECSGDVSNAMRNMDGEGLGASAHASASVDCWVTVSEVTPFTFTGVASIDDEDGIGAIGIAGMLWHFNTSNGPFSHTGVLFPGTWHIQGLIFVDAGAGDASAGWFGNFAEAAAFRATLTLGDPCGDPDLNQDGNVDQDDVSYLVNVIGGGDNPTGIDPDINRDGNADQDDVVALIDWVGGGNCP